MIIIFEQDITKRDGKRWEWKPMFFLGFWNGKRTWRVGWGFWSISYYPEGSLRGFYGHIRYGRAEWREKRSEK